MGEGSICDMENLYGQLLVISKREVNLVELVNGLNVVNNLPIILLRGHFGTDVMLQHMGNKNYMSV
jgi:hypothetical protein